MRRFVLIAVGIGMTSGCARGVDRFWGEDLVSAPVAPVSRDARQNWRNPGVSPERRIPPERRQVSVYPPKGVTPPAATYSSYDGVPAAVPQQKPDDLPSRDTVDMGLSRQDAQRDARKASVYPPKGTVPQPAPRPAAKQAPDEQDLAVLKTPPPPSRPMRSTPAPARRPTAIVRPQRQAQPQPQPPVKAEAPAAEPAAVQQRPAVATAPSPVLTAPRRLALAQPAATMDAAPDVPPMMNFGEAPPLAKVPSSLGLANIQAREAAPLARDGLERSRAGEAGSIPWDEAVALLKAGEIETYTAIGDTEIFVTLCSGRGVVTDQPEAGAIRTVSLPKIVCGREASLQTQ